MSSFDDVKSVAGHASHGFDWGDLMKPACRWAISGRIPVGAWVSDLVNTW